jgi:hypothetical protein
MTVAAAPGNASNKTSVTTSARAENQVDARNDASAAMATMVPSQQWQWHPRRDNDDAHRNNHKGASTATATTAPSRQWRHCDNYAIKTWAMAPAPRRQ